MSEYAYTWDADRKPTLRIEEGCIGIATFIEHVRDTLVDWELRFPQEIQKPEQMLLEQVRMYLSCQGKYDVESNCKT